MKRTLLFGMFLLGIFVGVVRWGMFYGYYANPTQFRQLSTTQMRAFFTHILRKQSAAQVSTLLRAIYPQEEPQTHGIGHMFGEELYRAKGAKAFGLCDAIFNYGCYHGVVDMAIRFKGLHTTLLHELFTACNDHMHDPSPCIHPLGHASTLIASYNVVAAFGLCDGLYPDPKVAFSCWNGVMMEEINGVSLGGPKPSYGDPTNPYIPCNTYPAKYEASCVSMHTSYLANVWGNDFTKLLGYCRTYSDEQTVDACTDAVGAIIAQQYFVDTESIIKACSTGANKRNNCIMGAVVPLLTARHYPEAKSLCASIDTQDVKRTCYDRIGL